MAHIIGVGFWSPGYADAAAWCNAVCDATVERPASALLEGALKRRATPLTRMAIEVLQQAAAQAGRDASLLQTVWANANGEHTPAVKLLGMMRGAGKLSPTQFHNSVHNTAGGYASIATANTAPSTTVSGGRELVASALLEAWCLLDASGRDVALMMADEPLLPPFAVASEQLPLSVALLLSLDPKGALASLSNFRRDVVPPVAEHPCFPSVPVSASLPLLEHVVRRVAGTVGLQLATEVAADEPVWCVDLEAHECSPSTIA